MKLTAWELVGGGGGVTAQRKQFLTISDHYTGTEIRDALADEERERNR